MALDSVNIYQAIGESVESAMKAVSTGAIGKTIDMITHTVVLMGTMCYVIMAYSISRSMQPFPVRRPVDLSGRREGEAPASPSGVWTIMRLSAGRVPRPPGGRIISVSIRKWNDMIMSGSVQKPLADFIKSGIKFIIRGSAALTAGNYSAWRAAGVRVRSCSSPQAWGIAQSMTFKRMFP
jgi:hypothetical protein